MEALNILILNTKIIHINTCNIKNECTCNFKIALYKKMIDDFKKGGYVYSTDTILGIPKRTITPMGDDIFATDLFKNMLNNHNDYQYHTGVVYSIGKWIQTLI